MTAAARIVELWPALRDDDCRCPEYCPLLVPSRSLGLLKSIRVYWYYRFCAVGRLWSPALVSLLFFVFLSACASKSHIIRIFLIQNVRVCNGFDLIR